MATTRAVSVRRLNALFQQARMPVFLLDAERRLVFVNRAWEELTGRTLDEVVGLACLPHGPSPDGGLDGLGGSFCPPPEALDGQPAGGPTLVVQAGGERHWKRVEYWPLRDGRDHLIGLLGFVRDPNAPPHAPESATQRLRAELQEVRERLRERHGHEALIGRGPSHRRLLEQVATAATTTVPVLIVGEPGTGKRLVARTIHHQGPHSQAPLLVFDVATLPAEVLDRELFGAESDSGGPRLRFPEGTSLLLGDLLELPRDLQARLARALETPGVRLLATTTADPDTARREGRLRDDLYFAMTGLVIRLLPLRERLDELPLLAQHALERANLRLERRRLGFAPEAIDVLLAYDWPGNLRELIRVLDSAQARATGDLIAADDLPASIRGHLAAAYPPPALPSLTPLDQVLEQVERRLIEQALHLARQNKSRAADLLSISRPRLYRRIKDLGIPDVPEPGEEPSPNANHAG